ncbi:MAG TPA: NAD-dependent malic enzyme [Rhizomicrobium sp.]
MHIDIPGERKPLVSHVNGFELINHALLNKGTAFTEDERDAFHLHGLLPPYVGTLEVQIDRRMKALHSIETDFQKYAFLRDLQDVNETLFYALLVRHIDELLPLVYTPTVGEGCERFSEIWRKPRGVFLSYPNRGRMREILANPWFDRVRVIVVSDGERILGLGDQGAGGMGIPIGKLSLYTACAGIHPARTLPILLDLGTNNEELRRDPLYMGWRHERVRGADYDAFVEDFVSAICARWPSVLLHWEDFAGANAGRLLAQYRDRLCTFNDDIQGTAAVATATVLAAVQVTGIPLVEQKIAIVGAGSAGCGIASLLLRAMIENGLSELAARERFYAVDIDGLLVEGMPGITEAQKPFVQSRNAVADWTLRQPERIDLLDVVANAKPTVLIGVSGQHGAFGEAVIRQMAENTRRPVILPISNPTARSEATPAQLFAWTDGRAIVGTGSPFASVSWNGRSVPIDQINNAYIFPGLGLGVLASGAKRVSDGMFMAAARALGSLSPATTGLSERLLPPVGALRNVSAAVGMAVARQAISERLASNNDESVTAERLQAQIWSPEYQPYVHRRPVSFFRGRDDKK